MAASGATPTAPAKAESRPAAVAGAAGEETPSWRATVEAAFAAGAPALSQAKEAAGDAAGDAESPARSGGKRRYV
jgi:hypothetical protein